jgi:hypothetical protein
MTQQEETLLGEMKAEPITAEHVKKASNFVGSMPYTHMALLAMAEVCSKEFEHEDLARILRETADKVAELECQVI